MHITTLTIVLAPSISPEPFNPTVQYAKKQGLPNQFHFLFRGVLIVVVVEINEAREEVLNFLMTIATIYNFSFREMCQIFGYSNHTTITCQF